MGQGHLCRMGSLTQAATLDQGMLHPIRASFAAVASGFFLGSRILGCPRLPSCSQGRHGRRLSPSFEHSRQMLSRLLRRWARKQRAAFKDQSSVGPDPPLPLSHSAPKHQPSVPLLGLSRGARSPRLPPIPAGTQPSLPRSGFPGLGCTRTEQLIYHPCAAPALRLLFATEKLGGKRKNFSSWPRQELKTYALAANTSPGARGDPGEPSTGFSTAAPAGVQPSC